MLFRLIEFRLYKGHLLDWPSKDRGSSPNSPRYERKGPIMSVGCHFACFVGPIYPVSRPLAHHPMCLSLQTLVSKQVEMRKTTKGAIFSLPFYVVQFFSMGWPLGPETCYAFAAFKHVFSFGDWLSLGQSLLWLFWFYHYWSLNNGP